MLLALFSLILAIGFARAVTSFKMIDRLNIKGARLILHMSRAMASPPLMAVPVTAAELHNSFAGCATCLRTADPCSDLGRCLSQHDNSLNLAGLTIPHQQITSGALLRIDELIQ